MVLGLKRGNLPRPGILNLKPVGVVCFVGGVSCSRHHNLKHVPAVDAGISSPLKVSHTFILFQDLGLSGLGIENP